VTLPTVLEVAGGTRPAPSRRGALIALIVVWVVVVGAGLGWLARYKAAPGVGGAAPASWPVESHVAREPGKATLVMLAHPHCPCTRASLSELEAIMARVGDQVTAHVLFVKPADADAEWLASELLDRAARIPHVTTAWDEGGRAAAVFAAKTSGDAVLYDAGGVLRYRGGITSARGHVGDNLGESAIVSLVLRGTAPVDQRPVYGCALQNP
jgi:hypothetical protein